MVVSDYDMRTVGRIRTAAGMIRDARGAILSAGTAALLVALAGAGVARAAGAQYVEVPSLVERVVGGEFPPVEHRLPARPSVVPLTGNGLAPGRHGGELRLLMGRATSA